VAKRTLLVALAGLAVVVAVGVVVLWPGANRVSRDNFLRLSTVTSRAELESLLGSPGDYRTAPTDLGGIVDTMRVTATTTFSGQTITG
jgi:hypothetical protein